MDEIDERLIVLLREDSRTPNVQLAKKIGITEGTVRVRMKRLTDDGIIRRFTIHTSTWNIKALIEVKIEVNVDTSQVSGQIIGMPQVEIVYEVAGDADIVAVVNVFNVNELNSVIEMIRSFGSVVSTNTKLVFNEL